MKKRITGCLLTICFLCFAFASPAFLSPLEVGVLSFPPYYVVENDTTVKGGYYVDMLKMIFDKAGVEHSFVSYPAKRLYKNLAEGITQVWMGTLGVAEYEGKTIVSPKQLSEVNLEVYSLGSQELLPKRLDDLNGSSVITIFGYSYGGAIKNLEDPLNGIKIEHAKNHDSAFRMLQAGRAQFLIDYKEPASDAIQRLNISGIKSAPIKPVGIFLHISTKVPDAQSLMRRLMTAYDQLKSEGKIR